jgi:RNA polymerase sigma-70 factor (ECF subfamily)
MAVLPFRQKERDRQEFDGLVESNLDGLYRVALRYTRDPARAEDLVQDTVVRALRFREHFELGTNFKAWIYTVLTHTFIHGYRRRKREREILEGVSREDVERQLRSESTELALTRPEEVYLDRLLSDDVVHALDALPEEFRMVVVLCDVEGLSYREIAETLDCPVGTVMSRLYRGRRLLEEKLYHLARERGVVREEQETPPAPQRSVVDLHAFRRRRDG